MASSHMRMRFQSPMLTTSDTAPMVQNCVLLPTAPKTKASAKAPHTTMEASAAGSVEVTRLGLRVRFKTSCHSEVPSLRSRVNSARRICFSAIQKQILRFAQDDRISRLLPYEALLGLLGRRARGILLDERAQRLARGAALSQLRLGAR